MRRIAALPVDKVPRDNEFRFKERSQALVTRWHTTLDKEKEKQHANGSAEAEKQPSTDAPTDETKKIVNGDAKAAEEDTLVDSSAITAGDAIGDVTMSEAA